MHQLLKAALAAAALSMATVAGVQAKELRMLTSWGPDYKGTSEVAHVFAENVAKASNGGLTITSTGPEAVPPFEQFEPVSSGVFDLLFTHGAYHYGVTGIGMSMDSVKGDPAARRDAGVWDFVDQHYQKQGLKLIALPTTGKEGYHLVLRKPATAAGDLAGMKIRGTPLYHPLITKLGGSPVVLPGGEIYSALEKGVIDGAAWPTIGALDFKWYEVAGHYLRPSFGVTTHMLFMNLDAWNALSDEEKSLLAEEGRKIEEDAYRRFDTLVEKETAELQKHGMQETNLSDAHAKALGDYWAEGVWGLVVQKDGEAAESLHKLVIDKGLAQ